MVLSAKGIALRGERARAHSASTIASKNESDARIWRMIGGASVITSSRMRTNAKG